MFKSLKMQDTRKKVWEAVNHRTRIITAGLGLHELRAVMRGDPPTEKPNPRYKVHTTSFIFHIRPRYYEAGSTILSHTFRLGFFTAFFFFVEVITGLILMLYYAPTPEKAYVSMQEILSNVAFGQFLRDWHRIGAEFMVAFTALHMLRTYLTGSYKKERSFTWLTGVVLLGITLFLSFSGYLLPWDQLAYWAVTIGTSMAEAVPVIGKQVNLLLRGAPDIGADGLLRFYLGHVVLLPLAAILTISIHYYKVSREHGISLPAKFEEGDLPPEKKKAAKSRIDFIPDLLTNEIFLTALGLLIPTLFITAFGWHAKLEHVANPQVTPLDTTAPWYFLWLQGLLKIGDKTLMGVILPGIIVVLLIAVPYIDRNPYRSMYKRPFAIAAGLLMVLALVTLTYMGTPLWGIETDAATRILQDMAPMEGVGPLRETPFEQLQTGTYLVNQVDLRNMCPDLDYGCPDFQKAFTQYTEDFNAAVELGREGDPGGLAEPAEAIMVVEDWQQDLKKITMRINATQSGKTQTTEKTVYIHRERGSE